MARGDYAEVLKPCFNEHCAGRVHNEGEFPLF